MSAARVRLPPRSAKLWQYPVPPEGMIFIHNRKSVPLGVIFDEDTLRFLLRAPY